MSNLTDRPSPPLIIKQTTLIKLHLYYMIIKRFSQVMPDPHSLILIVILTFSTTTYAIIVKKRISGNIATIFCIENMKIKTNISECELIFVVRGCRKACLSIGHWSCGF